MNVSPEVVEIDESEQDFQEPLDVNLKKRKFNNGCSKEESEEEDENELTVTCSICQTFWTNSGSHSIVNLKCGHVFGKSCIDNHIKDMTLSFNCATCPICQQTITKSEPRRIWPTKLIPEDGEDLNSLKLQITEAKKLLQTLSEKQATLKNEINYYKQELENVNPETEMLELVRHKAVETGSTLTASQIPESGFKLQQKIEFKNETYSVVDLNSSLDMAVIGTHNHLKNTFGLRKINLYDPTVTEFVSINHKNIIRDVKHSPHDKLILSTGDDKTLKLTSVHNNMVLQSYQLEQTSEACAFDETNKNVLYCGLSSGKVLVYDIRNTKNYTYTLDKPINPLPVLSIVPYLGTIVCSDRSGIYNWFLNEEGDHEYNPLDFPQTGSGWRDDFKSYSMDYGQNRFFISVRDTSETHCFVSRLEKDESVSTEEDHGCYSMLSDWSFSFDNEEIVYLNRNSVFQSMDQTLVCYSENNKVRIRNETQELQCIIYDQDIIIDIDHMSTDEDEFLTTLTKSGLYLYKFQ